MLSDSSISIYLGTSQALTLHICHRKQEKQERFFLFQTELKVILENGILFKHQHLMEISIEIFTF